MVEGRRPRRAGLRRQSRLLNYTRRSGSGASRERRLRLLGNLGGLEVEPALVELDAPLLRHGEVAGQGDDGVRQRDLPAAARLVVLVGVVIRRVAVADAVGEVL